MTAEVLTCWNDLQLELIGVGCMLVGFLVGLMFGRVFWSNDF